MVTTIALSEETKHKLDLLKARERFRSFDATVDHLLSEHQSRAHRPRGDLADMIGIFSYPGDAVLDKHRAQRGELE